MGAAALLLPGFPMPSYAIHTFGCQMNAHDSERMHEVLRGSGYTEASSPDEADVIVLNTCSVREKAEQKLRSEVGRLAPLKRQRPDTLLVVAGCMAQQEGERIRKRMPSIDVVLGPDNIPELPSLLAEVNTGGLPVVRTVFDLDTPRFLQAEPARRGGAPASAYVTIMKGCDERCSFCIVPYTRGPERYRPSDEIVEEIRRITDAGAAEITLLGQTVNSYNDPEKKLARAPEASADDPDESEFAALLRRIVAEVPALRRLRYTSPHPRHLTPSLIAAHRDLEILAQHVHMPVQSGSDRVLKRMIRRYTRAEYVDRVGALRLARPGLTLSTDVIVGFPGETDDEALATVDLIREVGFLGVFGFKYSQRPHTPALKLPDDVPEAEKGRRLARVFEASEALLAAHLPTLVGRTEPVLVEGRSKNGEDRLAGRTCRNEIVHLPQTGGLDLVGKIVHARITVAHKHSLEGELCEADRLAAAPLTRGLPLASPSKRSLPVLGALPPRRGPLPQRRQHLLGVARHLHRRPRQLHLALLVDHHRRPDGPHAALSIEHLLAPGPPGPVRRPVGVGQQREGQAVLFPEAPVRRGAVPAHPQHHRPGLADNRHVVAEITGLAGAPGGVILGVEINHHLAPRKAGQVDHLAVLIRQHQRRGRLPPLWQPRARRRRRRLGGLGRLLRGLFRRLLRFFCVGFHENPVARPQRRIDASTLGHRGSAPATSAIMTASAAARSGRRSKDATRRPVISSATARRVARSTSARSRGPCSVQARDQRTSAAQSPRTRWGVSGGPPRAAARSKAQAQGRARLARVTVPCIDSSTSPKKPATSPPVEPST